MGKKIPWDEIPDLGELVAISDRWVEVSDRGGCLMIGQVRSTNELYGDAEAE